MNNVKQSTKYYATAQKEIHSVQQNQNRNKK